MANVHGMNDLSANNPQNNYQAIPQNNGSINSMLLFANPGSDPRKEKFHQMFKLICCPYLTHISFTALITILEIIGFVSTLCYYGINSSLNAFIGPNYIITSFVFKVNYL